jgi:hypothetical protein
MKQYFHILHRMGIEIEKPVSKYGSIYTLKYGSFSKTYDFNSYNLLQNIMQDITEHFYKSGQNTMEAIITKGHNL